MSKLWNVSSSPHARSAVTTQNIMFDVALAMIPATAFGIYQFGLHAFVVVLASVLSCVLSEYAYEVLMKKPITISDGSALVTGMILGLNMPPEIPVWIPVLGGVFAIIIVKQLYGGLGQNFMNPALAARCFLLISFTKHMTTFTYDGVTTATPLASLKGGSSVDVAAMFVGRIPGTIGEVSVIALLLGAAYLVVKKVISLRIPAAYIITTALFVLIFGGHGLDLGFVMAHICGGGLIFGAFFMATDYVTSPITPRGQIFFGVLLGVLTGLFRLFGGSAEGVSYAIIISNILVPLIEKYTLPVAFGKEKAGTGAAGMDKAKLVRNASILFGITLVAGIALGVVYEVTKAPIKTAQEAASKAAYQTVFPQAAMFEEDEELKNAVKASAEPISGLGFGNVQVDSALKAMDESGTVLGYVVNSTSKDGYGGNVSISVGIQSDGTVLGIEFLSISETAGLGDNAKNPEFKDQYKGKKAEQLTVTKSGSAGDDEINAMSGATITSNAVTNAANAALYFVHNCVSQ